ncbi:hypothetical protein CerSpe_084380 [Prunus speciosa]
MEGAESSKSQGDSAGKDSVQESFLKLVNAHFVESCPAPEPVLEQATKQEGPAKKRGAKSAKVDIYHTYHVNRKLKTKTLYI